MDSTTSEKKKKKETVMFYRLRRSWKIVNKLAKGESV